MLLPILQSVLTVISVSDIHCGIIEMSVSARHTLEDGALMVMELVADVSFISPQCKNRRLQID